jgi:hypothetical protein
MLTPSRKNALIILTSAEMILKKVHHTTVEDLPARHAAFRRAFSNFIALRRGVNPSEWSDLDPEIYQFLGLVFRIGSEFDTSGMVLTRFISENLSCAMADLVRITKKHL